MVHLVQELPLIGPIHSSWCYDVVQNLYKLKKSVRNRNRPEVCMATAYVANKALGFVTDYSSVFRYIK